MERLDAGKTAAEALWDDLARKQIVTECGIL